MKPYFTGSGLLVLNCTLLLTLAWGLKTRTVVGNHSHAPKSVTDKRASREDSKRISANGERAPLRASHLSETPTPFGTIYSEDPRKLAENLRRVGCPEETVKDILEAEMGRKYKAEVEALRPTPADHVPWGWSPRTSESKLIERRQRAAAIAREKEASLRTALGYEVPVKMPAYAMTTSDQGFEALLDSLSAIKRPAARQIQENYWASVEELRLRTRGFWQAEDISVLKQFQQERKVALDQLINSQ